MDRCPSGIETLDTLLQGGFPKSTAIGLIGDVGSGKTTLCNQIVWNSLQRGANVLYYCVDESVDDVLLNMEQFEWDVKPFVEKGTLHFVDVFSRGMGFISDTMYASDTVDSVEPDQVSEISFNFREMILEGKKYVFNYLTGTDLLVIYDSFSPLFMAMARAKVLRFLQYAKYASRVSKAVGIATLDMGVHGEQIENACQQQADGVIELKKRIQDGHTSRFLRVVKMARTRVSEEYYPLELTDHGLIVHRIAMSF
jgi:KaiC/GvpD/RAD55 family RecA-like ATPase